ncbi:MAG: tyrosine-type recombinase/integrase [Brevinema sp.]
MKTPKSKKRHAIFSKDDIKDMLSYCQRKGDLDFMYYMITLYLTGSRPNEIVKLTYKDLDFKNLRVSIWMSKVQKYKTIALNKIFLDELMGLVKYNELDNGCLFLGSIKNKEFYSKKFKAMRNLSILIVGILCICLDILLYKSP